MFPAESEHSFVIAAIVPDLAAVPMLEPVEVLALVQVTIVRHLPATDAMLLTVLVNLTRIQACVYLHINSDLQMLVESHDALLNHRPDLERTHRHIESQAIAYLKLWSN